jgi:hypothetical protein
MIALFASGCGEGGDCGCKPIIRPVCMRCADVLEGDEGGKGDERLHFGGVDNKEGR